MLFLQLFVWLFTGEYPWRGFFLRHELPFPCKNEYVWKKQSPRCWFKNNQAALLPKINTGTLRFCHSSWFLSPPNCNNSLNCQGTPFSTVLISHSIQILNFRHSMYNTCVCPQCVDSTLNNTTQTNNQGNKIICEDTTQRLKFSNKIWCLRLSHITQTKDKKPNAEQWHSSCSSSYILLSFGMRAIIQGTHTLKQSWTSNTVCLHGKDRTKNSYFVHSK